MRKFHAALLTVTAVSVLIVAMMVLVIPDQTGILRTDAGVGDYYVLEYDSLKPSSSGAGDIGQNYQVKCLITAINEDGTYTVEQISEGGIYTTKMTKEAYYRPILLDTSKAVKNGATRAMIDTNFGVRTCSLYNMDFNTCWADSKNVIYRAFVGGVMTQLVDTNLFYQR